MVGKTGGSWGSGGEQREGEHNEGVREKGSGKDNESGRENGSGKVNGS